MHIGLLELKFFTILNWIHSNLKIDAMLCIIPILYEVHREGDCDLHLISFKTILNDQTTNYFQTIVMKNIISSRFGQFFFLLCFELYCETRWVFLNLLKIKKKNSNNFLQSAIKSIIHPHTYPNILSFWIPIRR